MFAKIKEIDERYTQLESELARPEVIRDQKHYQKLLKEHSSLAPIIDTFRKHEALQNELAGNRSLLDDSDPEIRKLAREEVDALKEKIAEVEHELGILLLPSDPNDEKNIILEIRAGTGGGPSS